MPENVYDEALVKFKYFVPNRFWTVLCRGYSYGSVSVPA